MTTELSDELDQLCERLKRSRSSIIVESLQSFFIPNAPKDSE